MGGAVLKLSSGKNREFRECRIPPLRRVLAMGLILRNFLYFYDSKFCKMSKNRSAALGFIFVTLLIDVIGMGIIIPVLPVLLKQLIGGNNSQAALYSGLLSLSYAVMGFVFSPVIGNLSDKFGRRPVLLIALFGFALDYLVQGFAPTIAWLFLGRILAGVTGATFSTATAYIADITPPEKRAQNFGMVGVAFGLGFIIGPALGGVLGVWGPRVPFFAAAALAFLNGLYGYFFVPESLSTENRRPFNWKKANPVSSLLSLGRYPVILGLVASFILLNLAGQAVMSTWTFFTMEKFQWTPAQVGSSLAFVGLMVAIVQGGLIRVINPRLGQKKSVYFGLVFYAIGFLLFAFASKGWMMYAFLVPYCLGGIAGPALQGIMSGQVPANEQGELQGALTSLMSLTAIIGPLLMTNLFSYFTRSTSPAYFPGAAFLMGAVLTVFSIFMAMRSLKIYTQPI
jgi:DHA1 family tetracycline resistance protein-like MFS transporter